MNWSIIKKRGFTLIELLVVVAIIQLLATIVFVSIGSARSKGFDAKRYADLRQLQTALALYYSVNNTYPVELCGPEPGAFPVPVQGWAGNHPSYITCYNDLVSKLVPTYISKFPEDPKPSVGDVYWYGTVKDGQGYMLLAWPEFYDINKGEKCYWPDYYLPDGYYCVGSNWQ